MDRKQITHHSNTGPHLSEIVTPRRVGHSKYKETSPMKLTVSYVYVNIIIENS